MGGELEVIANGSDESVVVSTYFRVRFGFRELVDGRICVAAFGPDLESLPESERLAWGADLIESPAFASQDLAFDRWSQRYLHGSWESQDGPLKSMKQELDFIQAMSRFGLGKPLFRETHNPALRYPVAENSEAFTLAQLELYRLVVDGLCIKALIELASKLKTTLPPLEPGKVRTTMNTLKTLLPSTLHSTIYDPLRACSLDRNRLHGVPSKPAHAFPAFKEFHKHANAIHTAIVSLRSWLEENLELSGERCLKREQAMKYFPKFDGPLRPDFKHEKLQEAVGKTIARVEAGEFIPGEGCHHREAMVLHFTDGTALAIDVGSNAGNLESDFEGLNASMFSADLIPIWAPNPQA